jgi:hypothetical protein
MRGSWGGMNVEALTGTKVPPTYFLSTRLLLPSTVQEGAHQLVLRVLNIQVHKVSRYIHTRKHPIHTASDLPMTNEPRAFSLNTWKWGSLASNAPVLLTSSTKYSGFPTALHPGHP